MENMKDGNILYKFLGLKEQNGKRTVRADFLDNQLFRFTQPSLLNDPFEMKPVIIMNKYSEEDYAVAREIATQYSGEYITRNFTHKDLETLILHKVGGRRLYEIRSFPQTIPEYRAEPFHSTDEIEQFLVNEIFSNLMNELDIYGIFSMTESRENLLMWSHYAEDHKGMVVGFERSHQFFNCLDNTLHQVEYCDRRLTITSNDGIIRIAGKENEIPLRLLSRKHTSWSHEKEWRVIRKLNESNRSSKEVFLFEVPSSAIRAITLGAQMSPEDTKNICEKIANNSKWSHITVYKAKLSEQKFDLVFNEI